MQDDGDRGNLSVYWIIEQSLGVYMKVLGAKLD